MLHQENNMCETAAELWQTALAANEACAAVRADVRAWLAAIVETQRAAQALRRHEQTCETCALLAMDNKQYA